MISSTLALLEVGSLSVLFSESAHKKNIVQCYSGEAAHHETSVQQYPTLVESYRLTGRTQCSAVPAGLCMYIVYTTNTGCPNRFSSALFCWGLFHCTNYWDLGPVQDDLQLNRMEG